VGNFQPGLSAFSTALLHPDGRTVIVISGGQAYHVDPESRTLLGEFGGGISVCIAVPSHSMLVFSDDIRLWGLAPAGLAWRTERISWDGIRRLTVSADHITGEACDPMRDVWTPFRVHLDSGRVTGGSYTEYFPQPKA
jgi:hypothetical protein